jgi:hypothetical protein
MNAKSLEQYESENNVHQVAFALVCPTRRGAHWKDQIDQVVTDAELREAGVTIEQVAEAVPFMTATEPTLFRVAGGWRVTAKGYRAGPAW